MERTNYAKLPPLDLDREIFRFAQELITIEHGLSHGKNERLEQERKRAIGHLVKICKALHEEGAALPKLKGLLPENTYTEVKAKLGKRKRKSKGKAKHKKY